MQISSSTENFDHGISFHPRMIGIYGWVISQRVYRSQTGREFVLRATSGEPTNRPVDRWRRSLYLPMQLQRNVFEICQTWRVAPRDPDLCKPCDMRLRTAAPHGNSGCSVVGAESSVALQRYLPSTALFFCLSGRQLWINAYHCRYISKQSCCCRILTIQICALSKISPKHYSIRPLTMTDQTRKVCASFIPPKSKRNGQGPNQSVSGRHGGYRQHEAKPSYV